MDISKPTCGMGRVIRINIDDPVQVDALFEACIAHKRYEGTIDFLRQHRSDEEIRRDNSEATADYERERLYGWSVE